MANCAQFAFYKQVSEAGYEYFDLVATHKFFEWVHNLRSFTLHMYTVLLCCKRFQPFITQTLHEKFTGKVMQQAVRRLFFGAALAQVLEHDRRLHAVLDVVQVFAAHRAGDDDSGAVRLLAVRPNVRLHRRLDGLGLRVVLLNLLLHRRPRVSEQLLLDPV